MCQSDSNPNAPASPGPSLPRAPTGEAKPGYRLSNVLYVVALNPTRKFGSLEEQVLLLAEQFRAHSGCFWPVFLPDRDQSEVIRELRDSGVEGEMLDLSRFRISALRRLRTIIRDHAIDIVHWNFYHPINNPYLWALKVLAPNLRHIYTDHISRQPADLVESHGIKRELKRRLLKAYERVLAVSDYIHDSVIRTVGPLPNLGRCTHFVNADRFSPDPQVGERVRNELGAADRFVVLIVASLIPEKGVDIAVRAMVELPETVILWVVGGGPEGESLQRLATELGLDKRVRFLGLQKDVSPFMKAASVLVCPSLWGEAAGLVNIEAMACGLPVVASRVGGIPEIVEEGKTGYLVPAGDQCLLASKILRLLEDPVSRNSMSLAARASAIEQFSAQRRLPEYLAWYRALQQ